MRGPPPLFSQVFILKGLKVVCFHALLQVLILKVVRLGLIHDDAMSAERRRLRIGRRREKQIPRPPECGVLG
jgi:hypothetical protein